MGKATGNYTPEQRAVMAERERLLKSPRRQAEQDRMRLIGENLGLTRIADTLRQPETAPPTPQEPTKRKARKQGGGRRPKFTEQQQQWLRKKYSRDLKKNLRLAKLDGAVAHVKNLAKTKYDIDAGRDTLLDQIIRPVRLAYFSMEK